MEATKGGGAWRGQICEWREAARIPVHVTPWSPYASGVPQLDRVQALLDVAAAEALGPSHWKDSYDVKKQLLKNVYMDVSQNPTHKAVTRAGISPCLCTSSSIYSFGADRFILPFELLLWQGHRRTLRIPESMRSSELRSLAGEGICLPCLGSIIWALYLTKGLP